MVHAGGKATVRLDAGDRLRILTPGAGGYGSAGDGEEASAKRQKTEDLAASGLRGSVHEYRRLQETA